MGIWGDAFGWAAKLVVREGAETGTKVVAKTVAEDGAEILAKKAAAEEAARVALQARHLLEQQTLEATHLAQRQALERGGADLTAAATKTAAQTGDQAVVQTATTAAKKSVNLLTQRPSWLIYYGSKDMTVAEKLGVLTDRGENGYIKLIIDNAKKGGLSPKELGETWSAIKTADNISPETKAAFKAIYDTRNGANIIGRTTANLKGSLSYAFHHPGRASLSALYNTTTGVVNATARTVWFSIKHPWLAAAGVGAAEVADQHFLGGAVTHQVATHVVDPLKNKVETAVDNKLQQTIGVRPFGTTASGAPAPTSGAGAGTNDGNSNGAHWYDWLKNMASHLTGGWAWLGVILSAVAWIAEQVTSLGSSLFSSGTKVQSNNPARVAAVAGTDPNIQAAVVNHNGQAQPSILDRIVPQLTPPAPAPG